MDLYKLIRDIPDWPKKGVIFRDITPLLADSDGLKAAIKQMADPFRDEKIDLVIGAESRGFIFGAAIAKELSAGFVPIRKPGKLPAKIKSIEYDLEYGSNTLEIHTDAIKPGQKVLAVDDLIATGGTMAACCELVEQLGGDIVGISFLIELNFLKGRDLLGEYKPIHSLLRYD